MKFDLISDLHLTSFLNPTAEFSNLKPTSSVLAVLGDVCEIGQFRLALPFFKHLRDLWDCVLYVPGNHEFYGGHLSNTVSIIGDWLSNEVPGVIVMDNEVVKIDGVSYIGSTLWSDMNKSDPLAVQACRDFISDYRYIKRDPISNDKIIVPKDTVNLFKKNVQFISTMLGLVDEESPIVVLTHHAPSYQSISPGFIGNVMNGAFVSELSDLILDSPNIRVWAHGHTHFPVDYTIGECRVVANPYGYRGEIYKSNRDYKATEVEVR